MNQYYFNTIKPIIILARAKMLKLIVILIVLFISAHSLTFLVVWTIDLHKFSNRFYLSNKYALAKLLKRPEIMQIVI